MTNSSDVGEADTLGYLEIYRDRVDADGPYFCLSRNRLEVYRYGHCGHPGEVFPLPAFAFAE